MPKMTTFKDLHIASKPQQTLRVSYLTDSNSLIGIVEYNIPIKVSQSFAIM